MNKKINYILVTIFFVFLQNISFAQKGKFYHIDATNGLTNLYINAITQDKEGFIWIGTQDGLFRYDGYEYKSFKNEIDNEYSISANDINQLYVDSKGRLWVATVNGLNLYDSQKEIFYRILADKNKTDALPNRLIASVFEDSEGIIWVGTFDGFSKLKNSEVDTKDFKFVNYLPVQKSSVENWIANISEDDEGNMWFAATYRGIYKFNKKTEEIINYHETKKYDQDFRVSGILRDSDKNLWISSFNNGILKYDKEKDSLLNYNIGSGNANSIHDIIEDDRKRIWVATNSGASIFDYKNKKITHYHYSKDNNIGLSSNEVQCMFRDRSGIIWFGHKGQGLDCYMNPSIDVQRIYSKTNPEIPTDIIGELNFTNDKLYFKPKFSPLYEYYDGHIRKVKGDKDLLLINRTKRFFGGYNKYGFKITSPSIKDIQLKYFHEIGIDKNENYYLQYKDLIIQFDKNGDQISDTIKIYDPSNPNRDNTDGRFILTEDNNILVIENDKIFIIKNLSGKLEHVLDIREIEDYKYGFKDLYIDGKIYWIISGHVLYKFNSEDKSVQSFNQDRILGDIIYSMIVDNDRDVWFTSNKGIVYLDQKKDKQYIFDKSDGIPTYNFSNGICVTPENVIYVSSNEGIIGLKKESFNPNTYIPPIAFTGFKLFNKEVGVQLNKENNNEYFLQKTINKTEEIILKYYQNNFTIEFSALNYKFGSKNQYKYILESLKNEKSEWKNIGNQRSTSFVSLPPGEYIFKVKASNNDGLWNKQARSLRIIIKPPFWQTLAFRISVIIFFLLCVFIVFRLRIRAIKNQKHELEKKVRLRTAEVMQQKEEIQTQADNLLEVNILLKENQEEVRAQSEELFEANTELQKLNSTKDKFFSIIAHDLKNPFQAINGFSEVLLKDFDKLQKEKSKEFIGFISNSSKTASSLLENLLEWARTQTNRIKFEPNSISIYEIASETIELLNVNAQNKKIRLVNNIPKNCRAQADKNMITTVLRNLLNNAIKFTPDGGSVIFSGKSEKIFIEIIMEDTGVGMDEKTTKKLFRIDEQISTSGTSGEAGTGLGLIICKEFIEKNNGSIKVESEVGKGSTFIIQLPIAKGVEVVKKVEDSEPAVADPDRPRATTSFSGGASVEEPEVNDNSLDNYSKEDKGSVSSEKEKPILLIAEDTHDIRVGIKAYLGSDFKVIEAEDGEEALKYAIDLIPDLIISDWMMPKMEGIELCEKLKTNSLTSHIPVIMLTAKATSSNKIQGFETGADEYMTKPFEYSLLKVRIKNLIQTRKDLQKKYSVNAGKEEEKIQLSSLDQEFMDKIDLITDKQIENSGYNIDEFSKDMGMSRAQLYRKVTAVTGHSPIIYLRNSRIKKAAKLLKKGSGNVSEIMYQVGFNNSSYFARSFKDVYKCTPSEYAKK